MELLILRHAEAENFSTSDHARRLTPKGVEQAKTVALFCQHYDLIPEIILSSPYVRTWDTALELAKTTGAPEPLPCAWVGCGMSPETACDRIAEYEKLSRVMIIGHEPDLGCLIGHLLGTGADGAFRVRKASLTQLNLRTAHRNAAELQFSLPVKMMRGVPLDHMNA